jgi:2'-5' RNA ligase
MSEKLIRTFLCIDFSDEVIKEIARVHEVMQNKLFTGKFTELENLHLTLKFLGEIEESKVEEIRKILREIKFLEFEAKLGEIGIFHIGKTRVPKIVWIKINGKKIWDLQSEIDKKLEGLFKKEERFMSHTTIARVRYVKDKAGFEEYIKNVKVKEIKFNVNCFKLKSSELKSSGPTYRDIEIFNLMNKEI